MKIAIVGYGPQGHSAYEYWSKDPSNQITICDSNPDHKLPPNVDSKLGSHFLENLDQFDLIVRTPRLHLHDLIRANGKEILKKVTTNTNEFLRLMPKSNIVGVTGTKGKGTTSTLIANMIQATGRRVHLGGNTGVPPLDLLKENIQPDDWIVLELANFQLVDLAYSPHIAICLMVVPEHLDWHTDMEEYIAAKQQLFKHQSPADIAIYYANNSYSERVASASPGHKIPYYSLPGAIIEDDAIWIDDIEICKTSDLKLLGKHNWQNVCAAVTAMWQVDQNLESIRTILTSFSGLEHRLELVREVNDVKYYDDSFGTIPETAIVALEAFKEAKVIILGGSDKGADYNELAETVARENMRKVLLIGDQASRIQKALEAKGFMNFMPGGTTMPEIVKNAQDVAGQGDVVLLSTACASFDMFKDYKDRGEQFKQAVQELV